MISSEMFWVAVIVITVIVEFITVGLTTIWMTGGALVALAIALLGGGLNLQIAAFFAVTFVLLYWTRPIAVKYLNSHRTRTNVEETLGSPVRVIERIDNQAETGKVHYKGMEWTARAVLDEEVFEVDDIVVVQAIEGVKMLVARMPIVEISDADADIA